MAVDMFIKIGDVKGESKDKAWPGHAVAGASARHAGCRRRARRAADLVRPTSCRRY